MIILVVKFAGQMELAGQTVVILILVLELAGQTTVVTVMTRAVELLALLLHQGEILFIGKGNSSGESSKNTNNEERLHCEDLLCCCNRTWYRALPLPNEEDLSLVEEQGKQFHRMG